MTTHQTDAVFLAEAAQFASEPDTEQAIQSILNLTLSAIGVERLVCKAQQDGFIWVANHAGHSSDLISTDHTIELVFRDRMMGELRSSSSLEGQPTVEVIARLLTSVLRERELDIAESTMQSYRDRMVRLVTHDLRTPLAQIMGYAHLLQMDLGERPDEMRFVDGIIGSTGQMDRLLESLLRLERLRHSPKDLYTEVNLYNLAHIVQRDCQYTAEQKGVTVETDFQPSNGALVEGDEFLIQRAMENLVTNALKFTLQDGRVRMKLRFTDSVVEFSVEDTGIGIAPQHLDYLFTPFHRITRGHNTEAPPGFGLGLSLVGSIVEQHNGQVFVTSVIDKGSVFGFKLPLII